MVPYVPDSIVPLGQGFEALSVNGVPYTTEIMSSLDVQFTNLTLT